MKVISIVVPSYNSEDYLDKCLNSLLVGGADVEIIIVNDGSKDKTGAIADSYHEKYPDIVKVVHKENGGHGDAVMSGVEVATGKYLKVCDSDDWFEEKAYKKVIETIKKCCEDSLDIDMFITNFVYEKVFENKQSVMSYKGSLSTEKVFGWDKFKLKYGKYILMHSVMFKTDVLKKSNLELPKHTFYVDNLYVYFPLPFVNNMYYIDVDLYRYYIGRDGQSVNEKTMIKRIDQQIFVNKRMLEIFGDDKDYNKNLESYMVSYLQIITTISSLLLIKDGTEESLHKKDELWDYIEVYDKKLYNELRFSMQGVLVNLPNSLNFIKIFVYKIYQKIWGFN